MLCISCAFSKNTSQAVCRVQCGNAAPHALTGPVIETRHWKFQLQGLYPTVCATGGEITQGLLENLPCADVGKSCDFEAQFVSLVWRKNLHTPGRTQPQSPDVALLRSNQVFHPPSKKTQFKRPSKASIQTDGDAACFEARPAYGQPAPFPARQLEPTLTTSAKLSAELSLVAQAARAPNHLLSLTRIEHGLRAEGQWLDEACDV